MNYRDHKIPLNTDLVHSWEFFIEVSKLLGALNKVNMFLCKTQGMWNREVQSNPWMLEHVPDPYKTQEMYNEAVQRVP